MNREFREWKNDTKLIITSKMDFAQKAPKLKRDFLWNKSYLDVCRNNEKIEAMPQIGPFIRIRFHRGDEYVVCI